MIGKGAHARSKYNIAEASMHNAKREHVRPEVPLCSHHRFAIGTIVGAVDKIFAF